MKKNLNKEKLIDLKGPWNMSLLRSKAKQDGYTLADLPEGVNYQTLTELLSKVQKREFSEEEKQRIILEYQSNPKQLIDKFLQQSLVRSLLSVKGKPNDPITNPTFYLAMVVRAISEQRTKEQEEMLLALCYLVQNCRTGQEDGIIQFYNGLPAKYRTSQAGRVSSEKKIEEEIDHSIQNHLNKVFDDTVFLWEVTGKKDPEEISHQVNYLKNRLHRQIGIKHQLMFDINSAYIEDKLFDAKTEDLLKTYFKYCTPESMVKHLQGDLKDIDTEKLLDYLEVKLGSEYNLEPATYLEFNEETYEVTGITKECAKRLLSISNYVV